MVPWVVRLLAVRHRGVIAGRAPVWHGAIANDPLLCKARFGQLSNHRGGAELEISVLFADVRGSTGLAERTGTLPIVVATAPDRVEAAAVA
jgi:class 3 adenylate cyclase